MSDDTAPVQTSLWLPRRLHDRLRLAAFDGRVSQSAILRQALEAWLRDHGNDTASARPEGVSNA